MIKRCGVPNIGAGDNPTSQLSMSAQEAISLACALARITSAICNVTGIPGDQPRQPYAQAPWLKPYVWDEEE